MFPTIVAGGLSLLLAAADQIAADDLSMMQPQAAPAVVMADARPDGSPPAAAVEQLAAWSDESMSSAASTTIR
ncbi:MAG: hypothetical protein LJE69_16830 [Thiohalocapsa sp.]|jgi:hypothetical protein|uniref:hypothetical protein n=1 Tax=Thiohalocapsa sp. TaxID=2497641 RepID=UPI0025FAB5A5|nr:hypothetical protein [Thiohalocapsa sp.]MCG6942903.1 hypothetical protein [Thiohalocapsa sp.]